MRETNIPSESLNRRVQCRNCEETLYAGATTCDNCGSEDIDSEWNTLESAYQKHDIGEAYLTGRINQMGLEVEHWGIDKRENDDGLIFDNKMDLRLWEPLSGVDRPMLWPTTVTRSRYTEQQSFDIPETNDPEMTLGDANLNEWDLRGVVDVKTKANEDWLGKFNLRHLTHYTEHAAHYHQNLDVPVFLYFTMVDMDTETVGERNILVPITADWSWERLADHYDPDSSVDLTYGQLKDEARQCPIVKRTFRAPDGNLVVTIDDDYYHNFDYFVEEVL